MTKAQKKHITFNKIKTDQMTNSQSYEYGEILGALISIENFSKLQNRSDYLEIETKIISEAILKMQTLFDSLNKE
tara:strand:- start:851 stop:1075 length:225 start_codon:yes stop_codon:yes gene_type:complete